MLLFRNAFLPALSAAAILAALVRCASAAPWWPMHFVMVEEPPSSLDALPTVLPASPTVPSLSLAPTATLPEVLSAGITSLSSAYSPVETMPAVGDTGMSDVIPSDITSDTSVLAPQPSSSTGGAPEGLSANQSNGAVITSPGRGGAALLIGCAVSVVYLAL
ncbi:hypothetical protein POSPLADRAFT_1171835 [Postia placenta MAD-698-R-SB12]|uniref:Uncharacterized protein n=1 Tax=Postia placenta MAD-698-R-SB12 TaxID=670580 RepID=A0A1X6MWM1_9APHY|nr:hypothetical protein POSPLADRAFT_1171835 [Postia placenta MAD-698-R-SB12]OSX60749.1 hypothetical protein POSPLADRAFT_1171835 [Postia placenta MAD-698-R-SB12]